MKRHIAGLPADCLDGDVAADGEPVAAVAAIADRVPEVALRAVLESDDVGRSHERPRALMLDPDGGSGKDEAIVLRRPGIVESGIGPVAAEGSDADQAGVVDHCVAEEGFLHRRKFDFIVAGSVFDWHQLTFLE